MGKARPRCGGGHAYLPANYRDWKNRARDALMGYWVDLDLPTIQHCTRLEVYCYGPGRHDGDNLVGALLDAGLPDKKTGWRGCWRDDRVTVFPLIQIAWHRSASEKWQIIMDL